jgi:small GTP-binding protein
MDLVYNPKYDALVKLLLIGDSSVGKSSLLVRFADDKFSPDYMSTIGIDYKIKTFNIGETRVKMEVWDTAGQERFRTITKAYYRGAMGVLLVYDVTSEKSFKQIQGWINLIKKHAESDVCVLLVANKCDAVDSARAISETRVKAFATEVGLKTIETSALSGLNVEKTFEIIGQDVLDKLAEKKKKVGGTNRTVSLGNNGKLDDGRAEERGSGPSCCNK